MRTPKFVNTTYDTETDTIDSPTENLGQVQNLSELELEVRSQLFYISPGHSLLYFALILAVSVLCRTNLSLHVSDCLGGFCFCFWKEKKILHVILRRK